MDLSTLHNTTHAPALPAIAQRLNRPGNIQQHRGFTSLLTKASERQTAAGKTGDQRLREAAGQLVSSALVKPLLAQIRQSPFKTEMFHGGKAEEKFGAQLDTILADRITGSSSWDITDSVVKQLARHQTSTLKSQNPGQEIDQHG